MVAIILLKMPKLLDITKAIDVLIITEIGLVLEKWRRNFIT
jgi:hypothetical protein